jgi:hypothetical protein
MKLEISRQIFEKTQISNFIKIRPVGAELFHVDRRTDMKLIFVFRSFAKAPKNISDRSFRENQNIHFLCGNKMPARYNR